MKTHRTKNTILIIFAVAAVGCLLYIPGMTKLGLYRDDWNNFYNAVINGPDMLIQHYASDRPADGYLLSVLFRLFGTNNNAYLIYDLCCRILSSILFSLTLLIIWPRTSKMAGLAGILAVAFPGFLQQVDGIAYVPHQTAMLLFMLSLLLTAKACEPGQREWNVLFTFLSLIFSFCSMILMEYYIGMEICRFALIYMMNREQAGSGKGRAFFKSILSYIPYLIPAAGFAAWRTFVFSAQRNGTDVIAEVVQPFLLHPRHEILDFGMRFVKNVWKLFAGVWTVPVFNLLNGMEMKPFVYTMIPVLVITAAAQFFLFLMHRKRTEESSSEAYYESSQWLWCGLITGTIAIFPMVLAGRDINFSASLDRFAWPGMIGTILFLVGLLGSLKDRSLRNILTVAVVILSVFVQWQTKLNYIDIWKNTADYWQQMIWRAPGLEEGTTIVSGAAVLAEEDYEVFVPASLIYYPAKNNRSPLGAEILRDDTVRAVKLGDQTGRTVREIYITKDYQKLLAVSKPNEKACLRVINGENPVYSLSEWSKIPEIGSYSKLSQIITEPASEAVIPFFLGMEQEHGWCYYYEKMELALQMEDPETAAKLADEAAAAGYAAGDDVELLPVVEAYIETGRTDDALLTAEKLREDALMALNASNFFSLKENSEDYIPVIDLLSGKTVRQDPTEELVSDGDSVGTGMTEDQAGMSDAPVSGAQGDDALSPEQKLLAGDAEVVEPAVKNGNSAEAEPDVREIPAEADETTPESAVIFLSSRTGSQTETDIQESTDGE